MVDSFGTLGTSAHSEHLGQLKSRLGSIYKESILPLTLTAYIIKPRVSLHVTTSHILQFLDKLNLMLGIISAKNGFGDFRDRSPGLFLCVCITT